MEGVYKIIMIRIGVIGGIGSGKSFIAKLFKYPVFNADKEVNLIYRNNKECFKKLKKQLPNYIKSYPVKKDELIRAISSNNKNLKLISSIVHPIVRRKMKKFLKEKIKSKIIILDIPLLIENKLYRKEDILVFVNSKKSKIISRLKKRKNFNEKIFKSLKNNQVTLLRKKKLANYLIDNNYSPSIMRKKIKILKNKILNERNST